jgi:hypothetical protein
MRYPSIHAGSRRARLAAALLFVLPVATCPGATGTGTQTLNALIYPAAKLSVPASVSLTNGATRFAAFQASLPISYRARTTAAGGGAMTFQVTSDFSPAGGPSAATGALSYTCTSANLGTVCSGSQTASTTLQTPVLTLPASACTGGGGACSAQDPNSMTLNFTVVDDPGYATGSYSAKVTLIISAT